MLAIFVIKKCYFLLWTELCSSKIPTLKPYPPVPQKVTVLEDRAFKELTKLKWDHKGVP